MNTSTIISTVACFGYAERWRQCVESQSQYAVKHGYSRQILSEVSAKITGFEGASWHKIDVIITALLKGYRILNLDADCLVQENAPPIGSVEVDGKSIYMARGHSGRYNAGVIYAVPSEESIAFFDRVKAARGIPLPKEDAAPAENGNIIHFSKGSLCVHELDPKWNNCITPHEDYIRHFTGPMRRFYKRTDTNA